MKSVGGNISAFLKKCKKKGHDLIKVLKSALYFYKYFINCASLYLSEASIYISGEFQYIVTSFVE